MMFPVNEEEERFAEKLRQAFIERDKPHDSDSYEVQQRKLKEHNTYMCRLAFIKKYTGVEYDGDLWDNLSLQYFAGEDSDFMRMAKEIRAEKILEDML